MKDTARCCKLLCERAKIIKGFLAQNRNFRRNARTRMTGHSSAAVTFCTARQFPRRSPICIIVIFIRSQFVCTPGEWRIHENRAKMNADRNETKDMRRVLFLSL